MALHVVMMAVLAACVSQAPVQKGTTGVLCGGLAACGAADAAMQGNCVGRRAHHKASIAGRLCGWYHSYCAACIASFASLGRCTGLVAVFSPSAVGGVVTHL